MKSSKNEPNKNIGYLLLVVVALVLIFVFFNLSKDSEKDKLMSSSEEIVWQYFEAWNKEDYKGMYSLLSDGFKGIDSNAKDLESFIKYSSSQNIAGVMINKIGETLNDGMIAVVEYSVEFDLNSGDSFPFDGEFTLKYRENDKVPGWKMIHPYGENIDTS